jgi:S-DNA-T family DNA segregation ATPase FtsK/SpoIIIE
VAQRQTNGTNSRRSSQPRSSAKGGKAASATTKNASWLDDRSKRDIAGVVLCVLAVTLMIAVVATTSGVATELVARGLRYAIGAGAYLLPIMLLLWGLSFFIRIGDISEGRTGIGLVTVVVSIISMLALGSPGTPDKQFFATQELLGRGGYLGASIAWALDKSAGTTIGYVVLSGVLLVGLVITGLSISGVVEWLRNRYRASRQPAPEPAARGRAPKTTPMADATGGVAEAAAATEALPGRRRREDAADPEAARKTAPTPRAVAPRRMEGFELPPFDLLSRTKETAAKHQATDRELRETAAAIAETLATFDIPARVVDWVAGPTVTLFEVEIAKGVRLSKVTALADDLALALAASQIRILAPIPGKSLVGIEVPNVRRSSVTLGDALAPAGEGGPLVLAIGKDVAGAPVLADLATMPHLLIGGTTGSGKSVAINAMLVSILMRSTPSEVRLILIDPKRVELSLYNGVPHLYVPVVTEPREAASALAWSVSEMERRLKLLSSAGARNIGQFNAMIQDGKGPEGAVELPYLVIVIDELADLMMVAAKEVEDSICRIAQLARAAGIHLIVATQRPEANVVTGLIKANITNRIAFNVASAIDSRVILDQPGADKLVGLGDMLFSIPAWPKPKRIQGCYVAEDEIEAVVNHLKQQSQPDYHEEILHLKVASAGGGIDMGEDDDPLLWEAADIVVTSGIGSTSLLQRRLSVGYARAGRIMDMLEAKGIVGPPSGSKPREVLVEIDDLEALKAFERQDAEEEY